jgi:hypothetical protein
MGGPIGVNDAHRRVVGNAFNPERAGYPEMGLLEAAAMSMHRFPSLAGVAALSFLSASLIACAGGGGGGHEPEEEDDEEDVAVSTMGLITDRKVRVTPWVLVDGKRVPGKTIEGQLNTPSTTGFASVLGGYCLNNVVESMRRGGTSCSFVNGRAFNACTVSDNWYPGSSGPSPIGTPVLATCLAHQYMAFAEATTPYYLVQVGTTDWAVRTSLPTAANESVLWSVDPSSPSDRASWALVAAEYFREAAASAGWYLSSPACADGSFEMTCGSAGNVDYADMMTANLLDSLSGSLQASEKAATYLHASAKAKNATRGDRGAARSVAWRDPYDSLLRAATPYVQIPTHLFNTRSGNTTTASGSYPVVTSLSVTDADRQAEELIRKHRINPTLEASLLANELVKSLNLSTNNAYSGFQGNGLGYLATLEISADDLVRAAKRIVQETKVLGRPLKGYTENGVQRASGIEKTTEPVNPWYLYAITETAGVPADDPSTPDPEYGRKGNFHVMDLLVSQSDAIKASGHLTEKGRRMFDSALQFAKTYVGGRLNVVAAGNTSFTDASVRVIEHGAQPHAPNPSQATMDALRAEYSAKYDVWLGEEGLLCALQGVTRRGQPCDPASFKFREGPTNIGFNTSATASADLRHPFFFLRPVTDTPGTGNPYVNGSGEVVPPRIYVTKVQQTTTATGEAKPVNVLLAGFTLNLPGTTAGRRFLVPISTGLAEALQTTLGVDPLAPDETAQLCGKNGLSRNVKVGLEDELLQAQGVNSSNTVEESWSYYLELAKAAADEADMLGTELVDRGLEMDMRAEEAREELEDLCGGTVNVGDLRGQVCSAPYGCDLTKFLKESTTDSESLSQLKQCLGLDAAVDAALGSNSICAWEMEGLPPCTCPPSSDPRYGACPARSFTPQEAELWSDRDDPPTRACALPLLAAGSQETTSDCESLFIPPRTQLTGAPRGSNTKYPSYVKFKLFKQKMGLVPVLETDKPAKYPCAALAQARKAKSLSGALLQKDARLGWTKKSLGATAERLSVDRDRLNFVTIQRDGVPWLSTAGSSSQDDPNPWAAKTTFPCAPIDNFAIDCANNPSLLCSMSCNAGGTDAAMIEGRQRTGERLAKATELLRLLSGKGLKDIEVGIEVVPGSEAYTLQLQKNSSPLVMSYLEMWLPIWGKIEGGAQQTALVANAIELKTRTVNYGMGAACKLRPWVEEPSTDDWDQVYCGGVLGNSDNEDLGISSVAAALSTSYPMSQSRPLIDIEQVCIHRDATRHPVPSSLPSSVRKRLPPVCLAEHGFSEPLWLTDAGEYYSWPTVGDFELNDYWTSEIKRDLSSALNADTTRLLQHGYPRHPDAIEADAPRILTTGSGAAMRSWPALSNFNQGDLLDAMELACLAQSPAASNYQDCEDPGLSASSNARGIDALARARGVIACRARQIREVTSSMGLADAPAALVQQLSKAGVANIYPTFGGQYAQSVNDLHRALQQIATLQIDAAEQAAASGLALEALQHELTAAKYRREAAIESALAEIAKLEDECTAAEMQGAQGFASGMFGMVGSGFNIAGFAQQAVATAAATDNALHVCDSAATQEAHARVIQQLSTSAADEEIKALTLNGSLNMVKMHAGIERTWRQLMTAYGDAQGAIAALAAQRKAAHRAAAKLLMLDNDEVGTEFQVNTAMRARLNTLRVRYERARDYAVRMAYLARRSIEQKIGIDLSSLGNDVGWVPAPRGWADTICALEGIDYSKIRDADKQSKTELQTGRDYDYANQFVGDYVQKLEEFMTAYVNSYVSRVGEDVALVSVRDELIGVRNRQCDAYGPNLLLQSYTSRDALPFLMSSQDAEDHAIEPVWEGTCQNTGVCARAVRTNSTPLAPYTRDARGTPVPAESAKNATDLVRWGPLNNVVKATRLQRAQQFFTPEAPPLSGLGYWYRVDSCTLTATAANCTDRSGNARNTSHVGGVPTYVASGIGGKPTLSLTQTGSMIRSPGLVNATSAFTFTMVLRNDAASNELVNDQPTLPNGTVPRHTLTLSENNWTWRQQLNPSNLAAGSASLSVQPRLAPPLWPTVGDILTVRGGPTGIEIYVNGVLRGHSPQAAVVTKLVSRVAATNGPIQWAETLAYTRRLDDTELEALHTYLRTRYAVERRAPTFWFSADVLQEFRTAAGVSALSGYAFPGTTLRDAASGLARSSVQTGFESTALVQFANGHHGLPFAAGNVVAFRAPAIRTDGPVAPAVATRPNEAQSEYAATLVARCDTAARHRLFSTAIQDVATANLNAGRLSIEVDGTNGRVQFENSRSGVLRASGSGLVACGPSAEPFIVTLRASKTRGDSGTTDLFVDGRLVYSEPSFEYVELAPAFGSYNSVHFVGSLAEAFLHVHGMSDEEVFALHADLGASYDIATANSQVAVPEEEPVDHGAGRVITAEPTYRQWTNLESGTYLLSWYEQARADTTTSYLTPVITSTTGQAIAFQPDAGSPLEAGEDRWLARGWVRHFGRFTATRDTSVGWQLPSVITAPGGVLFAAPQLEYLESSEALSVGPSFFVPTDDDGLAPIGVCEDAGGERFRASHWQYGCEAYCPPGTGTECGTTATDPSKLPRRCFHELKFRLSQEEIEKGKLIPQGGFAAGNFNYRWEEIAVNVVGTGVKNCALSELPSACYANNFLQYSLRHDGPFTVRNYLGRDYEAPIFPGRIQQGKALMAERYLTNPLSGADRNLLDDFWDHEFVGRPLEGNYTLRVYDADGLAWEALEDIQLVMHYRYWTRLE